ncbi:MULTISPECIES: hypothetical protein [Dermacoccus]|uniref:hypothetical protein n=1 Tax=Dermacoccus TaxID=57495 RepID=UPI0001E63C20|nr:MULTISPECIES: hypothetical protein [Dermacoccus]EFP58831.1 hypothetical protein HMPREF0321_1580 [Dermacoccus sp. Ellin185]
MNGSDYSTTTLPLLFVFISFVVTFLVTRLIRAGKGPFKGQRLPGRRPRPPRRLRHLRAAWPARS